MRLINGYEGSDPGMGISYQYFTRISHFIMCAASHSLHFMAPLDKT